MKRLRIAIETILGEFTNITFSIVALCVIAIVVISVNPGCVTALDKSATVMVEAAPTPPPKPEYRPLTDIENFVRKQSTIRVMDGAAAATFSGVIERVGGDFIYMSQKDDRTSHAINKRYIISVTSE